MDISNFLLTNKYGCWISNGVPFSSKIDALIHASQIGNTSINFYYHDHIWDNFDRSVLGKIPLTTLYKERAQQLRDTYDYLILHYSGGSDSHNILHTFLKHNIKLDEISVRWASPLRGGKIYQPSNLNTNGKNAVSEWDYAIEPTLKWLKANRPEIKINVIDYACNIDKKDFKVEKTEKEIMSLNINRGGLHFYTMWSDENFERKISSIKNAGHIFGIEKPLLYLDKKNVYMQFQDSLFETSILPQGKSEGRAEMFYWSNDFPILPFEQAYQTALFFKNNYAAQKTLSNNEFLSVEEIINKHNDYGNLCKKILYHDSWDFRKFQADKPNILRSDWYFWIYENSEFDLVRKSWNNAMNNITSAIDDRFLIDAKEVNVLRPLKTKPFYLMTF